MLIRPAKRLRGRLTMPGDKSVSHRAAILSALARGRTRVENFSTGDDCASTLRCLEDLGVGVERRDSAVVIEGACVGPGAWSFREPGRPLDCGNSGTTMRLLAGVLAAQGFAATLTGDDSLRRRPMRRVIEPLELMGARVTSEEGRAPLRVEGRRPLGAIEYRTPVASAQVKSCVLLAGLGARGRTRVIEAGVRTRDHTERMMRWLGIPVKVTPTDDRGGAASPSVEVVGPAAFDARDMTIPGDISSAAFLLAAAALLPDSELSVGGVGLNPTRAQVVSTLQSLGAGIEISRVRSECNEPVGEVVARGGLSGADRNRSMCKLGGAVVAQLIDELPLLAVVGTQIEGGIEIRDAGELRVKESDRIGATVENLRAMGAEVEEFEDGLRARGPVRLRGARLRSFGDHRVAMAFTVAALAASGETEIEGAEECIGVSFPEFFGLLESVAER